MIYAVSKDGKKPPKPVEVSTLKQQGWSEKDLEDHLFQYLKEMVGPDLMVIHQSRPWQPEVDLLERVMHLG